MAYMPREDLEVMIENMRNFTSARMLNTPVGTLQRETGGDREARGPSWVSRVKLAAPPEDDVRQIILDAIRILGTGKEQFTVPAVEPVQAQWTGFRANVGEREREPKISEEEKFHCMSREVRNSTTILYAHGGANYLLSPASRRATTTKLAELTGGKCLSLQHRLAPQQPFPAAPLDFLIAYLSLLYPPPGSFHKPTSSSHIVFAGDSSGSELALSVVNIIFAARKQQGTLRPTIRFHGNRVQLPMPAGLAFQSPSTDHQHNTLPSWAANVDFDIIPTDPPGYEADFPTDDVWPATPPRGNYYCDVSALYHPLVSPMAVKSWRDCPPIYMAMGSKERIVDGGKVVAQLAASQDVCVLWDEYELMPHNWPMVLPDHVMSTKCYRSWAEACLSFVEGRATQSRGEFTEYGGLNTRNVDIRALTHLKMGDVMLLMESKQKTIRPFTGGPIGQSKL